MNLAIEAITKRYAQFSGRARRKEYWLTILLIIIISIIASVLDGALGLADPVYGLGPIYGIVALAILIPSIAVSVRRLHDIDRTGWWYLLAFVPFIGFVVLIIFFVMPGTSGENRFGPDPKAGD